MANIVTQEWTIEFEPDLDAGYYTLNNGVLIPLPARGKLFPKRAAKGTFRRVKDDNGKISYHVLLVPIGKDSYWLRKWLLDQTAESLLSKAAAIFIGGRIAPIAAGVFTILIPSETAATYQWKAQCSEGPVYGVTSGFNV